MKKKNDVQRLEDLKEEEQFRRAQKKEYSLYLKRKLQLIIRDPLAEELIKEFDKLPLPHDDWPEVVQNLHEKLVKKWNVHILSTKDQKYRYALSGWTYDEFVDLKGEYPLVIGNITDTLEPIRVWHVTPYTERFKTKKQKLLIHKDRIIKEPEIGLFPEDDKLLIEIDLNLIKLNDARDVKKTIWEYIARHIKKRKENKVEAVIANEPQEILPLYRCREITFNKYLRWYDINAQEKLGFRIIAFIEKESKGNPIKAKELLGKIKYMSKKPKVGTPVKGKNKVEVEGEDAVEKGVKLIYKAIHRKSYRIKHIEAMTEEYNCPQHGNECSAECSYQIDWYNRIKRIYPA
ncbi:MAG: hypothetical protein GOV02_04375 [Candidatus Aenigmarchaeota archaeon]|nr:hypothetical protein [Candidatus Aenigmarchaeota archaeon]